ncbi:Sensor protein ZraS [bioreactor metagenome]|uniref:histidine kinase n=1 Tax=bioreactor metagenome TaxID=1076179 RepID=A0A645B9F1_9ZZZZ
MEGDRQEGGEAQSNKWMAVLNQSAYRLLRMVSAVELEQAMADGQAFHPTTIDLAGLCHSLEMEVAPLAKQIGLTFSYDSADLSLLTTADAGLLRSMLLGLISNAMKAVGQGGRLGLRLTRRGERAVITIWDDGPGMDERSLGSLFRTDSGGAIPRPKEGLRLGLLNARSIAALHDGVLVVESKQGHGARFTVSLPIKPPEGLQLRTPRQTYDRHSGFSSLLVELSDALPWQVFLPDELE